MEKGCNLHDFLVQQTNQEHTFLAYTGTEREMLYLKQQQQNIATRKKDSPFKKGVEVVEFLKKTFTVFFAFKRVSTRYAGSKE